MNPGSKQRIAEAAAALKGRRLMAFTGAGISVESGIPPFRGPGGLWTKYDPAAFEIDAFLARPGESWRLIKEIFFDFLGKVAPNPAHLALAELERAGLLSGIVTQNIDNLHQEAGSSVVYEFHGNMRQLRCLDCNTVVPAAGFDLSRLPPVCPCGGLLKPDLIFFGEAIPSEAYAASLALARYCEACLVVGTTGEVMPACRVPLEAKRHGALVVEINVKPSAFTGNVTDHFLQGKAGETLTALVRALLD